MKILSVQCEDSTRIVLNLFPKSQPTVFSFFLLFKFFITCAMFGYVCFVRQPCFNLSAAKLSVLYKTNLA